MKRIMYIVIVGTMLSACDPAGMMAVLQVASNEASKKTGTSSSSTRQSYTSGSSSSTSSSASALPALGYGEKLVWEDQGVRASYRYTFKKEGVNRSGKTVSEWSLTVYVKNYSGKKISIGDLSVSFWRFSQSDLPAGWSYVQTYNPKFSTYFVNDKSTLTYQMTPVQTFGSAEPDAPTVSGGFRFSNY